MADTSVTGWVVMAFKSAQIAGLKVPAQSFEGAMDFATWVTGENGLVGYLDPAGAGQAVTGHNDRFEYHVATMSSLGMLLMFLPMILLFFYMTRSQSKKQKDMEASLKTGDRVITQSGLVGRLVDIGESRVKVEIAPGVTVQMLKSALSGVDAGDVKSTDAKTKEPGKESGKEKSQEKKA